MVSYLAPVGIWKLPRVISRSLVQFIDLSNSIMELGMYLRELYFDSRYSIEVHMQASKLKVRGVAQSAQLLSPISW